jgi:hypothetical protein
LNILKSVIFHQPSSILGDHNSEPVAFDDMRSLSSKQQGPRDILMNRRDKESSDDESSDDELLSVKDILEEFLGSKPEVIDLTLTLNSR